MTKAEIIAVLSKTQAAYNTCQAQIDEIDERHNVACDAEKKPFDEERNRLYQQWRDEEKVCAKEADFIPFRRGDFIVNESGNYYEVERWNVELDHNKHELHVTLFAHAIRKSGTSERHSTSLRFFDNYRKADVSEHLCLRRCLKMRLRRRLEGGD